MSGALFRTLAGVAVPAVTTDQMREVDRVAVEEVGPNLFQMMENAGRNLALTAIDRAGPDWANVPILVLAGAGGNGGGGICAARHLANRGADVTLAVSDPNRLGPVPSVQLDVYRGTSGRMVRPAELGGLEAALIVDAVIGYGLRRAPEGVVAEMVEWMSGHTVPVVALDVPSGLDSTTGETPGVHVEAAVTMTLALPKTGLVAPAAGEVWLADIGIPAEVYRRVGVQVPPDLFGPDFRVRLLSA